MTHPGCLKLHPDMVSLDLCECLLPEKDNRRKRKVSAPFAETETQLRSAFEDISAVTVRILRDSYLNYSHRHNLTGYFRFIRLLQMF